MILLFDSIHRVLWAERALKRASVPHELIPTPKEHSAECGMCIRIDAAHVDSARGALGDIAAFVALERDGEGER